MMVKDGTEKKKVSLVPNPGSLPENKHNKEDTRHVQPYLTCALRLRLGDRPAVPVHDRSLGASWGTIAAGVSDGTRSGERPLW